MTMRSADRQGPPMGRLYRQYGKRSLDVAISACALLILSPILAMIALLVGVTLGRPVFFRQQRPGLLGRPFVLVKFRTMTDARDAKGRPLPDRDRLPAFGRFLRRTSLDELPEIWNILRGDLSVVGPRPLLMQYLPRYSPEQARRHEVRPGVTGLAQVSGRNALTWDERFRLDVYYVDHFSFGLDLRILGRTLLAVLQRRGISAEGQATMYEFLGQEPESTAGSEAPRPGDPAETPANRPAKDSQ